VRIINCARGGIINEQALFDALESGHVAGASVDVSHAPQLLSLAVLVPMVEI
jgi:D-3-phosphoglycerate dehydrogenase / 2-oxoglutarate reductase